VNARINRFVAQFLPPIITDAIRRARRRDSPSSPSALPEWEAVPDDDSVWTASAGWSHDSIAAVQRQKWPSLLAAMAPPKSFGRSHEADLAAPVSVSEHNIIMTFGYVLGRAATDRRSVQVLDWGGGMGHYHALARALRPDLHLNYTVKDLPGLCALGRELNPDCRYVEAESMALSRSYDLVFASSSIHYSRDVHGLVRQLCSAADPWLMITRQPVIERHDDFVVLQRAHAYGYLTEYPCWFLNRTRLVDTVRSQGLELEREFLLDHRPVVHGAPEQCRFAGFLFRRTKAAAHG
jgi:putative methyltransferase (TIGR04325 family)